MTARFIGCSLLTMLPQRRTAAALAHSTIPFVDRQAYAHRFIVYASPGSVVLTVAGILQAPVVHNGDIHVL